MNINFALPRFKGNEPLLDQLSATRLNAILDAIDRARVVFGDNITGTRAPGGTIVRAKFNSTTGEVTHDPFEVSSSPRVVDDVSYPAVAIEPGTIAGLSPYLEDSELGNVQLMNDPPPRMDIFGDTRIVLRCDMSSGGPESFQALNISAATIQVGYGEDIEEGGQFEGSEEVPDLEVVWDDDPEPPASHMFGHFYFKIADVTTEEVESVLQITDITQYLDTNFTTFVVLGNLVTVLV